MEKSDRIEALVELARTAFEDSLASAHVARQPQLEQMFDQAISGLVLELCYLDEVAKAAETVVDDVHIDMLRDKINMWKDLHK